MAPSPPSPVPESAPEYAPELSARERLLKMLGFGLPTATLLAFLEFNALPWLKAWLNSHPCARVLGFDIDTLVFYALFCGPFVLLSLAAVPLVLLPGLRILRDGQMPPRGVKVWQRTPVRRGRAARRWGYFRLAQFVVLLAALIVGCVLANELFDSLQTQNPQRCAVPLRHTI